MSSTMIHAPITTVHEPRAFKKAMTNRILVVAVDIMRPAYLKFSWGECSLR